MASVVNLLREPAKVFATAKIYSRWLGGKAQEVFHRGRRRWKLSGSGPVRFQFSNENQGLFAHLNFCLYLKRWAELTGRTCVVECHSPNYLDGAGQSDWLPHILEQKVVPPELPRTCIKFDEWSWLPFYKAPLSPASLQEAHDHFHHHFSIHSTITKQVDTFVEREFRNHFVIGVHYRGTDKFEAPRADYGTAIQIVERTLRAARDIVRAEPILFIATDEEAFLREVQSALPETPVRMTECLRSSDGSPIHLGKVSNGLQRAREAVVDSLLLGRSHLIIKTASLLSSWSSILGSRPPILTITQPFEQFRWFPSSLVCQEAFLPGSEAAAVAQAAQAMSPHVSN